MSSKRRVSIGNLCLDLGFGDPSRPKKELKRSTRDWRGRQNIDDRQRLSDEDARKITASYLNEGGYEDKFWPVGGRANGMLEYRADANV